ncbi:MAG: prepilin-type N-terminal cleavage/methylation domain-containing protein [Holosporales bacterium]|jgi:prepilin-type N-terminal cleavage/methylation domain-containing protein|nr:prepilin-type N-terminal cleavage/methylation domain-containing protein [Holosporales bacterium]
MKFCVKGKSISRKLNGFSLIEISIVLLIIGIIAGGILKGRDLIESAQIKSVADDIQNLQIVYASYLNSYGVCPGDDGAASLKFGEVENGDGDGKTSENDAKKIFSHLYAAGLIDSAQFKNPKFGGAYDTISENGNVKLRISDAGKPFLTGKQIISLTAKMKEALGEEKVEVTPEISSNSSQKYIIKVKLN